MWAPKYQCGRVKLDQLGAHMAPGVLKLFATLPSVYIMSTLLTHPQYTLCLHCCLTLSIHDVYTVVSPSVYIIMFLYCCLTLSIHYVYTVSSPWVCPLWRSSWVGKTYSSFFSPLVPKDSSSAHAPKNTLLGGSKPGKQKIWILYYLSGAFV